MSDARSTLTVVDDFDPLDVIDRVVERESRLYAVAEILTIMGAAGNSTDPRSDNALIELGCIMREAVDGLSDEVTRAVRATCPPLTARAARPAGLEVVDGAEEP